MNHTSRPDRDVGMTDAGRRRRAHKLFTGVIPMRALSLSMLLFITAAGASPAPEQVIRQQADMLLERISVEQSAGHPPDDLENLVVEIIAPHVDFALFSKLVLGKHWRTLSAVQQQRFEHGMTDLVVKTYATAVASASGLKIDYLGTQVDNNPDKVVVATVVKVAGNPPVKVDYKLYERDGVWKVYDVVIEGVSMAINYRTVMAERIRSEGIDAVIQSVSGRPGAVAAM